MAVTHGGDVFAIAREHGWDWREVLDFSASINPLGPAPGVSAAICQAIDRITHYPEREPARLRRALAERWNLDQDQILLGNGATELIFFIARMFPSTSVTLSLPVFSEFHRAFPNAGTAAPHGLLVLTRPANPTGVTLDLKELRKYLTATEQPVLVDESFLEFSGQPSAATLLHEHQHLIVLRSLTKFYALPGLRVGALIASSATIRKWREHREPWQVNVLAEEAALAAVNDTAHAEKSIAFIQRERSWLYEQLQSLPGVIAHASDANFLYVPLNYSAAALCEHLLRFKILVRNCTGWTGLAGEAVRIAVRTRDENERLLDAWRQFQCD